MASVLEESCKLQIQVQTGQAESGAAKYATRSISNVNVELSNEDALSVMAQIGNLQKYTVTKMTRVDTSVLGE